ncbi:MAG: hypothetical protein E7373_00665 [Clostridiales bacterium]|nr:hypothetical protein [Clostridiales bacterium]
MQKKIEKMRAEKEREELEKALVKEIEEDFKVRQKERLKYEKQWVLNMNFASGNQYCKINAQGELADDGKTFYWQNRGVYNHIAPILESRLAKFSTVLPNVSVRPKSDDDKDVAGAVMAEKLIAETFKKCDLTSVAKKVTVWSETCGSGFYKVVWNENSGNKVGELDGREIFDGQVSIIPVSPFEIFPDSIYTEDLQACTSIIHAKAVGVEEIKKKYNVTLKGEEIGVYNLNKIGSTSLNSNEVVSDAVVIIERYEKPTEDYPNGRLITVAGGKVLYNGELPFINGEQGKRVFPFVKQNSISQAGCFFGTSIVERLIPVQRAFNAVKNRKHEFLNRLSMGVMTVEDGSVDIDDLEEEGLSPGKILVYRQGSKAPEMMSDMSMPEDFNQEENKLINEFVIISGVSDVSSSASNATLTSASALEILVEQDNSRLVMTAEEIRKSFIEVAKQTIRLYGQFTVGVRAVNGVDSYNKTKIYYADSISVTSDDVYLESENELLYTNRQKKDMIFKLYESGILQDDEGKLRPATKEKILSLLGYKELDYQKGLSRLHEEKAQKENEILIKDAVEVDYIDDDSVHIDEHVRYLLSEYGDMQTDARQRITAHVKAHENNIKLKKGELNGNN